MDPNCSYHVYGIYSLEDLKIKEGITDDRTIRLWCNDFGIPVVKSKRQKGRDYVLGKHILAGFERNVQWPDEDDTASG